MVQKQLLRLLLNYKFYQANKDYLIEQMFASNLIGVYKLLKEMHEKYPEKDFTSIEIKELYFTQNPTLTIASKDNLSLILDNLPDNITNEIANEILTKAWKTETGRQLTQLGINIVNGKAEVEEARTFLQKISERSITQTNQLEPVSNKLDDILASISTITKWKFNIHGLQTVASGIGPGIFTIVFARPEVGKTTFHASLCAAPDGFLQQGAKINVYCNEEAAQRVQIRYIMALTGQTLDEITQSNGAVAEKYNAFKSNLKFYEVRNMDISDIDRHIAFSTPDIAIFDQLDKLYINGNFGRGDERLGALYTKAREIATGLSCATIAISQANAEAEGRSYMASTNLAEARTSKAAEGDLVIGIGKNAEHDNEGRLLNFVKNKITGRHTDVFCRIDPLVGRYYD